MDKDDTSESGTLTPLLLHDKRHNSYKKNDKRSRKRKQVIPTSESSTLESSSSSDSPPERHRRYKKKNKQNYHGSKSIGHRVSSTKSVDNKSEVSILEKLVNVLKERNSVGVVGTSGLQGTHVIPNFDPQAKSQTMKDWLAKINESAEVYGWSERQTIFNALPKLNGLAKCWYDGLTSVKYSWCEWQIKLLAQFPGEQNYGDLLSEMLGRKSRRNETLEEYYYDKIMLINRCELKGRQAVHCLTHGIYDYNVRMNVQGADCQEPEDVLKYFRSITTQNADFPRIFNKLNQDSENHSYMQTYNRKANDIPPNLNYDITKSNTPIICYNCGNVGHVATKCPKEILKCNKCRRFGHIEHNCSATKISTELSTNNFTTS